MAFYIATSLNDIAAHFERMADNAETRSEYPANPILGYILRAEAQTWRAAAQRLRNTELKPAKEEPK